MKKIVLAAALLGSMAPAFAFMTLKSCVMVNTTQGVRWLGTYCDSQDNCIKRMTVDYCPYMI